MEIANILLSIAGDDGNQVFKQNVTPAEVAVLRVLHGDEAVKDVDPVSVVERSSRAERARLVDIYAQVQPDGSKRAPAIDMLFPGVAARLFEKFEELDLPEDFFKPATRVSAARPIAEPIEPIAKKRGKAEAPEVGAKKRGKAAPAPEPQAPEETAEPETVETDEEEAEDGIGEINDGIGDEADNMFK